MHRLMEEAGWWHFPVAASSLDAGLLLFSGRAKCKFDVVSPSEHCRISGKDF